MTTESALMDIDGVLRHMEATLEAPWLAALDGHALPLAVHDKLILVLDAVRNARREAADHLEELAGGSHG